MFNFYVDEHDKRVIYQKIGGMITKTLKKRKITSIKELDMVDFTYEVLDVGKSKLNTKWNQTAYEAFLKVDWCDLYEYVYNKVYKTLHLDREDEKQFYRLKYLVFEKGRKDEFNRLLKDKGMELKVSYDSLSNKEIRDIMWFLITGDERVDYVFDELLNWEVVSNGVYF